MSCSFKKNWYGDWVLRERLAQLFKKTASPGAAVPVHNAFLPLSSWFRPHSFGFCSCCYALCSVLLISLPGVFIFKYSVKSYLIRSTWDLAARHVCVYRTGFVILTSKWKILHQIMFICDADCHFCVSQFSKLSCSKCFISFIHSQKYRKACPGAQAV